MRKMLDALVSVAGIAMLVGLCASFPMLTMGLVFAEEGLEKDLTGIEQQVLGRKYAGEDEEVRIQRLEGALNAPRTPGASLDYRKDRLYRLQGLAADSQKKQLAIAAYNEGIDFANQGENERAMTAYRQAIQWDPTLVQAYNNLAHLLLQDNQYDETVKLYQDAIAMRPQDPLLHRNLGVLYEKMGKIQDAIQTYVVYLKYAEQPDPPIQAIVDNYRANRAAGGKSTDYVSATTRSSQGQKLIWPQASVPVRVCVKPGNGEQLFVLPIIQKALNDWQEATGGRLRFKQIANPSAANILIELKEGPLTDPTAHIGRAEYQMPEEQLFRRHQLNFVTVTLNTGTSESNRKLPPESLREQIYRMALHELGHSIGIWGHSPDPGDIMFAHPIAMGLSERDIRTIRKLYGI